MTLLCLLVVPFIGGSLCCWLQRFGAAHARRVALGTMALTLALAAGLWLSGDYSQTLLPSGASQPGHWAQHFSVPWIPRLGIRFSLGLDGLSLLLVTLTALLGYSPSPAPGGRLRATPASSI